MRVFIPKDKITKEIVNVNFFTAYEGFQKMGWEICFYEKEPPSNLMRGDVVVGYIDQVQKALTNLGVIIPDEIDYPEELKPFFKREITKSTINKVNLDFTNTQEPVFVKPVRGKMFDGRLIESLKDFISIGSRENFDVWISTPIKFVAESRCFVRYNQIMDNRQYKGDPFKVVSEKFAKDVLEAFESKPAAFCMDFGVTETGEEVLIEVNDAYALGCYGLFPTNYAKVISARWHDLVDLPDPCQF